MASDLTLEERIRNRNSWLRIVVVTACLAMLLWKLASASFSIAQIGVSELLALLLSFFAIGLSTAFYFKATDTSNLFYDNTYKFTKDVSEILGRIEAGFGERLRHLDEGYSGLRDSFARLPLDKDAATQVLKVEEATAKKLEKERKDILAHLADRANLQEAERNEFFARLKEKEQEVRQARAEVHALKRQLGNAAPEHSSEGRDPEGTLARMERYITTPERRSTLQPIDKPLSLGGVRQSFARIAPSLHPTFLRDMQRMGFVDGAEKLTIPGARWLRGLLLHGQRPPN